MTNHEASIIIGNIPIDGQDDCYTVDEYQEAKALAIQVLEQSQDSDLISRNAVLKICKEEWMGVGDCLEHHPMASRIVKLPSISGKGASE